jgi:RNA polymerase sigma factor (sigma-70 family)
LAAAPDLRRATAIERQPTAPEARTTHAMYEAYAGQIFGYCMNQLGNREEAEDAVQSTFMNAFRGLQRGVVPEAESAWLFKIAHNVCLSRRRAAFRRGRVEFANDLETLQEITPSPSVRETDDLIRLNDVLATMPENQRKAILLREWQGLSYHEIGQEMELSQSAVETLIFRARRSLAAGLEAAEPARKRLRSLRHGSNLGTALVAFKSLVAGSAAVVAAGSVAAAGPLEPLQHHFGRSSTASGGASSRTRAPAKKNSTASARAQSVAWSSASRNNGPQRLRLVSRPAPSFAAPASRAARHARASAPLAAPAAAPPVPAPPAAAESPSAPTSESERKPAVAAPEPPAATPAVGEPEPPAGGNGDKGKAKDEKGKGKGGEGDGKSGDD